MWTGSTATDFLTWNPVQRKRLVRNRLLGQAQATIKHRRGHRGDGYGREKRYCDSRCNKLNSFGSRGSTCDNINELVNRGFEHSDVLIFIIMSQPS
jgi:hypothetical protein